MPVLTKKTVVHAFYYYRDIPAVGGGIELMDKVEHTLICGWNGAVIGVGPHPDQINTEDFEPIDKGAAQIFGCDSKGNIILSITLFQGDARSKNPSEQSKHFRISKTSETHPAF